MNNHTCGCGRRAVTEIVAFVASPASGDLDEADHDAAPVRSGGAVYVFPYWCPRCFAAKFAPLARAEMTLRQAVGMARARDMIQRERWGG